MIVHRVFWQQRQPDFFRQFFAARLQFMPLGIGELAHVRVGFRIIDKRGEVGDFLFGIAIGLDRRDDGAELGEFPRQLDVSVRTQAAGELAFHQRVAGKQRIKLLLRQDNQSCSPSAAAKLSSLSRMETLPTGCSRQGRTAASPLRISSSSNSALTGPIADGESESVR